LLDRDYGSILAEDRSLGDCFRHSGILLQKWAAEAFNVWKSDLLFSDLLFVAVRRQSARSEALLRLQKTFMFRYRHQAGNRNGESQAMISAAAELIAEGARRYDEYQWLRAVVPDDAVHSPAGSGPECAAAGEDPAVCKSLWLSVVRGLSPAECELPISAEPIRLARLLARRLEDNLLKENLQKGA
jgi:hypothetical protein